MDGTKRAQFSGSAGRFTSVSPFAPSLYGAHAGEGGGEAEYVSRLLLAVCPQAGWRLQ